jgi:hypothetical protein
VTEKGQNFRHSIYKLELDQITDKTAIHLQDENFGGMLLHENMSDFANGTLSPKTPLVKDFNNINLD